MDVKFNERLADELMAKTAHYMKFGDIVINHNASEDNPIRIGVFLKRSGKNFNMTDCKGTFWQTGPQAKIEVVGSVLKYPGDPLFVMDVEKHRRTRETDLSKIMIGTNTAHL